MCLILLVSKKENELNKLNFSFFLMKLAENDDDENTVELLHLFGTSTPLGIVSPFIRTNFPTNALPYYVYSIGRNYSPHSGQSSCIELLGMIS
jgi:hypothetical protein